ASTPVAGSTPVTVNSVLVRPSRFVTFTPVVMVPRSVALDPLPLKTSKSCGAKSIGAEPPRPTEAPPRFNSGAAPNSEGTTWKPSVAVRRHQGVGDGAAGGSDVRGCGVDVLVAVAEVEGVIDRPHRRQLRGVHTRCGVHTLDGELRIGQAQQVRHVLSGVDAADLGGTGSGAAVDVERLGSEGGRQNFGKARAEHQLAATEVQQRRSAREGGDGVETLATGRQRGVEGGGADREGVGT